MTGIINAYHSEVHWGQKLTFSAIRVAFWWLRMQRNVYNHVKFCEACQRFGSARRTSSLEPLRTYQSMEMVEVDFSIHSPSHKKKPVPYFMHMLFDEVEGGSLGSYRHGKRFLSFLNRRLFARFVFSLSY